MKRIILGAVAVSGVLFTQSASAETQTANMAVSASVSSVCTVGATPLAFGEVLKTGVTTAATPGEATLTVNCTGGGAYTVGLGNGLHNIAAQRYLQSGANTLAYDMFKEIAHATRWGDAGAGLVSGTGSAADQELTVFGQVTTGQALVSGNGTPYTDTILVTLTY
jgi:spore coat protein U-like protein